MRELPAAAMVPALALSLSLVAVPGAPARSDDTGAGPAGLEPGPWRARGAEVLAPFKRELKQALVRGLEQGPAEAVSVCRVRAPELARAAGAPGVRVGRTSHRLRNPANAPEPWMEPLLAAYRAHPEEREPRAVALPDGGVGYVEPIFVQPLCVTCHGESPAPAVAERLAELYPEDEATGFEVGDFRGLFWVEFLPAEGEGDDHSGGRSVPPVRFSGTSPSASSEEVR